MSKTYLLLIGGLIFLVLAVGGFAFYKSSSKAVPIPSYTQPATNYPNQLAGTSKNQIALTVTSPKDNTQVSSPTLKVVGKTVANADVFVNDQDLKADATGNFTATVNLEEGDNFISFTAIDDSGNVSEQEITVTYTPSQ